MDDGSSLVNTYETIDASFVWTVISRAYRLGAYVLCFNFLFYYASTSFYVKFGGGSPFWSSRYDDVE
jgi:hypothetical protein